uniref:Tubulin--tyrosine ligase-like protein 12 SET-like domain-containing protein n=1 Tax=Oryza meridionalis TaxID=40149 RepID=A0A0E0CW17_9ORYZ
MSPAAALLGYGVKSGRSGDIFPSRTDPIVSPFPLARIRRRLRREGLDSATSSPARIPSSLCALLTRIRRRRRRDCPDPVVSIVVVASLPPPIVHARTPHPCRLLLLRSEMVANMVGRCQPKLSRKPQSRRGGSGGLPYDDDGDGGHGLTQLPASAAVELSSCSGRGAWWAPTWLCCRSWTPWCINADGPKNYDLIERKGPTAEKGSTVQALWLNDNPALKEGVDKVILDGLPELEIYNSHFTRKAGEWALGFCGDIIGADNPCSTAESIPLENIVTLDLLDRCIHKLPEVDIPVPLGNSAISILECLPNLSLLNGINVSSIIESGKHIIDSALKPRLPEWSPEESLAERVIGAMWLYLITYRLADEEKVDETPVWYVMDELGSAMRHCDDANFRIAPFLFIPDVTQFCGLFMMFILEKSALEVQGTTSIKQYLSFKKCDTGDQKLCLTALRQHAVVVSTVFSLCIFLPILMKLVDRTFRPTRKRTFPFEACLVMKHHLAETIHKLMSKNHKINTIFFQWHLKISFNSYRHGVHLNGFNLRITWRHLSPLIGDYCVRKRDGMDNLWIMKP